MGCVKFVGNYKDRWVTPMLHIGISGCIIPGLAVPGTPVSWNTYCYRSLAGHVLLVQALEKQFKAGLIQSNL